MLLQFQRLLVVQDYISIPWLRENGQPGPLAGAAFYGGHGEVLTTSGGHSSHEQEITSPTFPRKAACNIDPFCGTKILIYIMMLEIPYHIQYGETARFHRLLNSETIGVCYATRNDNTRYIHLRECKPSNSRSESRGTNHNSQSKSADIT